MTEGEAAVFTLTRSGVTTDALTVNVSVYRVVASPGDRATVTVADNDGPAVSFEASTYVVAEGERVTVRAVLSGPPGEDIVVPLTIVYAVTG